jgi:hypothetical protein
MECQTKEWEELYEKRVSPRAPNPKHYYTAIHNDTPSDGEIRAAVKKSSNGRAAGASNMLAEHLKAWLTAMQREEEDLERKEDQEDIWKLKLVIPAGILRTPVFSVPVALFSQESQFLFHRNLFWNRLRNPVCMGPM